jgi:hypothetical protein
MIAARPNTRGRGRRCSVRLDPDGHYRLAPMLEIRGYFLTKTTHWNRSLLKGILSMIG